MDTSLEWKIVVGQKFTSGHRTVGGEEEDHNNHGGTRWWTSWRAEAWKRIWRRIDIRTVKQWKWCPWHRKASAKTHVSLTRFLQSEVKIIHIIVQNNTHLWRLGCMDGSWLCRSYIYNIYIILLIFSFSCPCLICSWFYWKII